MPTLPDKIVQRALRSALEPIFEAKFQAQSYGFRPGWGCKDALRRVDGLLGEGFHWVVDADIESYFDRINHLTLLQGVAKEVSDGRVRMRLRNILRRRRRGRGRGRSRDHQRRPTAYFAERGLFSMAAAHAAVCQSLRGIH